MAEPAFAREVAALLASGASAVISHCSAARYWKLAVVPPGIDAVDVTLLAARRRSRPGLRFHRTTTLDSADVVRHHALVLTTPARTILDIAPRLTDRELERTVDDALARRLTAPAAILSMLARAPKRSGSNRVRALITDGRPSALTRSEAEERLLALVRRAQLPHPRVNVTIAGYEVDFMWAAQRLVVEVDGYAFHSSRSSFERDRRRDLDLRAAGYGVLRVSWRQLVEQSEFVLAQIVRALVGPGRPESA